ncbi:hypothetical protein D3C87_1728780 [compost metagenome]
METIIINGIQVYRDISTGKIVALKNSVQAVELTEDQEKQLSELLEKFVNKQQ